MLRRRGLPRGRGRLIRDFGVTGCNRSLRWVWLLEELRDVAATFATNNAEMFSFSREDAADYKRRYR